MASGIDKYEVPATCYELLIEEKPVAEVVQKETTGLYDLLAANTDVTAAEIKLMEVYAREQRLKTALAPVKDYYDFIIIDCPPSLNMLTVNAMTAADSVLVPMQCEYYALEGLTALMDTISKYGSQFGLDQNADGKVDLENANKSGGSRFIIGEYNDCTDEDKTIFNVTSIFWFQSI